MNNKKWHSRRVWRKTGQDLDKVTIRQRRPDEPTGRQDDTSAVAGGIYKGVAAVGGEVA